MKWLRELVPRSENTATGLALPYYHGLPRLENVAQGNRLSVTVERRIKPVAR